MIELYKKLEAEVGFKIDPENYKSHRIKNCFIILWNSKLLQEKQAAEAEPPLTPLTEAELDRIMSTDNSPGISGKPAHINKK